MALSHHDSKNVSDADPVVSGDTDSDKVKPSRQSKASSTVAGAASTASRNVKVAEAVGVALGIVIVAAIVAVLVFLASRSSGSEAQTGYSSDWSTPSDAPSDGSSAALERLGATYQLDGSNGTADFGSDQTVSWSVASNGGKTVLQYTNSMGVPIKSFSVTYTLKSSGSSSDVKAALDSITGGFTGDIDDSELSTWKIGCSGSSYSPSGASGETSACVLGGYQLTDASQLSAFRPVSLSLVAVDATAGSIDDYAYSFTSNSATVTTDSTIGGWPGDTMSARIPEPTGQVYYDVRETDEGMSFSILETGTSTVYDSYVSQCTDMGWVVESSSDGSTSFASKDGYTLTVASNSGASSVDVLLLSDTAQSADASSSADSSSESDAASDADSSTGDSASSSSAQ